MTVRTFTSLCYIVRLMRRGAIVKRRPDEIKRAVKRMNKGVKSQAAESARVCEVS